MEPIKKIVRPDGIIELTVVEEVKYLFFFRRKITTTFLGKPETFVKTDDKKSKKPKTYGWYKGKTKVPANTGDILSVLSEFYNIE